MKYFLSLCSIIKDENNLIEFILYHWLIGFEHFFIYDNDSNPSIKNILNHYIYISYTLDSDKVTSLDVRSQLNLSERALTESATN